ncbi:MAG: substrate-binding domain-containing protein [Spirochaetales bacterium]|nr:substrate-binding domain-containing protein [Spirochaetales bacterium]
MSGAYIVFIVDLKTTHSSKLLSIGLAIDWTGNYYHEQLINGIRDQCDQENHHLFIFVGGSLDPPEQLGDNRNILYQHISDKSLDGLIISAASLAKYCDDLRLEEFCFSFKSLPVVTLSIDFPNLPSVTIDNHSGMKELTEHFILNHNTKKILFLKGRDNSEGRDRYQGFLKAMEIHKLEIDPRYIYKGDLSFEAGSEILKSFLKSNLPFDAVIASNDDMARGAISTLIQNNLYPGIAVGGFDNQQICDHLSIPLTSVEQPIYQQGVMAVKRLTNLINGERDFKEENLSTRLVIRQSCGCQPKDLSSQIRPSNYHQDNREKSIEFFLEELYLHSGVRDEQNKNEIKRLIKSIDDTIRTNNKNHIRGAINSFFSYQYYINDKNYTKLVLYSAYQFFKDLDPEKSAFISDIITDAFYQLSLRLERDVEYSTYKEQKEVILLRSYIENFVAVNSMEELTRQFSHRLAMVGVNSCFLSLYEKNNDDFFPKFSRLIFCYKNHEVIELENEGRLFPSRLLAPEGFIDKDNKHNFTIEALFFGENKLGFCLFEFDESKTSLWFIAKRLLLMLALNASVYVQKVQLDFSDFEAKVRARTEALSKANELLGRLYEDRKEAEQALRKLNEELEIRVNERTRQLEDSNKQLTETLNRLQTAQSKLVQSEKMAALGGLVAGVAHEINTPMGIGVTAASHLEKLTKDLESLYKNSQLKKSDLEQYFQLASEASSMVLSNLRRAYELISSFKKIAVDQSNEIKRKFFLKSYLNEIIISLKPRLKQQNPTVTIICDDTIEIMAYPGAISQIITNFIVNSLIHGFKGKQGHRIKILIRKKKNSIYLRYFDDGKGISRDHIDKIFNPFYTTNRIQGGTGLGLHLVFNIVTQTLDGTIKCISRYNGGTLFKIIFPV